MRIDLVLKHLCLAKSRSLVKGWCDRGLVAINHVPARPSSTVRVGDRVTIQYAARTLTIELRDIPAGQVSKPRAPDYYIEVNSNDA